MKFCYLACKMFKNISPDLVRSGKFECPVLSVKLICPVQLSPTLNRDSLLQDLYTNTLAAPTYFPVFDSASLSLPVCHGQSSTAEYLYRYFEIRSILYSFRLYLYFFKKFNLQHPATALQLM